MKTQFKYAFLNGLSIRGIAFAVILVMNAVFIILGFTLKLPFAVHVVFMSLGGIAVAAMFAANIGSDVIMIRRMFASQDAYLQALTPVPRWKTLLANVITMMCMDIFTMFIASVSITWISFNYIGNDIWQKFWDIFLSEDFILYSSWSSAAMIACYLLFVMVILFCAAAKKSFLYKLPASGFLAFLLALVCFYIVSLLQIIVLPMSSVQIFGIFIMLSPNSAAAFPLLILLTLLEAAGLFVLTSKLIERKINI